MLLLKTNTGKKSKLLLTPLAQFKAKVTNSEKATER